MNAKAKQMLLEPEKTTEQTDFKLAQLAASGNSDAQRRIVDKLLDRVKTLVNYLCGGDRDADDWVQLSLLEILHSLQSYQGTSSLGAWADRITIRTTIRHLKSRRKKESAVAEHINEISRNTHHKITHHHTTLLVRLKIVDLLGQLPPKLRVPLVLKLVNGYSVDEIATLLQIPKDTVKGRLKRGRQSFLKLVQSEGSISQWITESSL